MIQMVKTIRLFPANWESKSQNNECCAENSGVEAFQIGELGTNRYFPNHSVYRLILTLGIAHWIQQSKKQWSGMLPCTHDWALGLCTVFKHTSTSCDPAMKETKKPFYTVFAALTWNKPWFPGSLYGMACVPQEHTNHDHTAVLWEQTWHLTSFHCCLQLEVGISSLSQHWCQNALAPGMADDHTSILLIKWPNQIKEWRGCCKNTCSLLL